MNKSLIFHPNSEFNEEHFCSQLLKIKTVIVYAFHHKLQLQYKAAPSENLKDKTNYFKITNTNFKIKKNKYV